VYSLLVRSCDSIDKSVDDSVLKITVLYLFTKYKSPDQHIKLMSILTLYLVPLLPFRLLSLLFLLSFLFLILLLFLPLLLLLLLLPLLLLLLLFLLLLRRTFADDDPASV